MPISCSPENVPDSAVNIPDSELSEEEAACLSELDRALSDSSGDDSIRNRALSLTIDDAFKFKGLECPSPYGTLKGSISSKVYLRSKIMVQKT